MQPAGQDGLQWNSSWGTPLVRQNDGNQGRVDPEDLSASEVTSLPEAGELADYVHRPLQLRRRPAMTASQKVFTGLFYGQLAFQLLSGLALALSKNAVVVESGDACPPGWSPAFHDSTTCISPRLAKEVEGCKARLPSVEERSGSGPTVHRGGEGDPAKLRFHTELSFHTRRLESGGGRRNRFGDIVRRAPALPFVVLLASAGLCAGLLAALTVNARGVVYGIFAADCVLLLYGTYLSHNWMLLVALLVAAALAAWRRASIEAAITAMGVGAQAVKATPAIWLLSALLQLAWFLYALVFMTFAAFNMPGSKAPDEACHPTAPSVAEGLFFTFCPFCFVLTTLFFRHCVLAVVSLAVGSWCFKDHAEAQGFAPTDAARLGLQCAFTGSCGTIFGASLILTAVDALRRQVLQGDLVWTWCDPLVLACRLIWCAVESSIRAFTRFALIGHMFVGDGLCHVAELTGPMLRRQLPTLLTGGIVAETVTEQLSWMTSTAIGFFVWLYLDSSQDLGFFHGVGEVSDCEDGFLPCPSWEQLLLVFLTLVMVWCVRNPIVSIIGALLFSGLGWDNGGWSSFLLSVILASLVSVIFNYLASVLEFATDTALYCMALEMEGGQQRNVRLKPLRDLAAELQEQAQTPGPVPAAVPAAAA